MTDPLTSAPTLADQATSMSTALLLGLRSGEEAVAWADERIHAIASPPTALFDLSLTPPGDLSALRDALASICHAEVPHGVVLEMLSLAARDLAAGRRDASNTVRVFAQMRRMLPLTPEIAEAMDRLEDDHMLAVAGMRKTVAETEAAIVEWLARYGDPTPA